MNTKQVINQDPDIHGGVPVFAGTRVPIRSLIDHIKAGDSLDYFLEGFPSVSREQAIAYLEFVKPMTFLEFVKDIDLFEVALTTAIG